MADEEGKGTIIIKALSLPKCEGFIRLNPNVISFFGFVSELSSSLFLCQTRKCFLNGAVMNLNLSLMPQELNKY